MERNNRNNAWIGGLVLIILGVVFLFQNITGIGFGNWWALFILIPALWAFWRAWGLYQEEGKVTRRVANMVYGGLFPFLVAVLFLFNLDWGRLWPVFLIVAGIGVYFGLNAKEDEQYLRRDKTHQGHSG